MSTIRRSLIAVTFAAAVGAGGAVQAADRDKDDDRPGVRHCTNDPDLASDLYEYLEDCPAAQGMLNRSGAWVAVERGAPDMPGSAGRSPDMTAPGAPGGASMGTPGAPDSTGPATGTRSAPSVGAPKPN
ncbi:MAG: hypothetical protein AB7O49_11325 [Sphingomonadales bacterium]